MSNKSFASRLLLLGCILCIAAARGLAEDPDPPQIPVTVTFSQAIVRLQPGAQSILTATIAPPEAAFVVTFYFDPDTVADGDIVTREEIQTPEEFAAGIVKFRLLGGVVGRAYLIAEVQGGPFDP